MLTVLVALLTVSSLVTAAPAKEPKKSIWAISIFKGPAPSPEDGPPASASALRDSSKLKYEVIGIVCSYLAWIALTGVAIFIVCRRLRQKREGTEKLPPQQMQAIKPTGGIVVREMDIGPLSPKSPGKMASIKSWARGSKRNKSQASLATVSTRVDDTVVDSDRARNMDEMAKLYAAVMAHDEERASHKASSSTSSSPIVSNDSPVTPRSPVYPPSMAHPAYRSPQTQQHYEPMPPPAPPMENDTESLLENPTPRKAKSSVNSLVTSTRIGSSHSNRIRPAPITVSGKPISRPLGSADLRQSSQSSLPSVYSPGPAPPTPGKPPTVVEEIEMQGQTPRVMNFPNESTNSSSNALPFRQFYNDALKSAPATKTTFLDRRQSALNPGAKTGVPKTPYSPYCPQTPMTPVTPRRLLGKEELKKNKKQYALNSVREDDLVAGDDDMWGTK